MKDIIKKPGDERGRPLLFVPCPCRKPVVHYFDSREIGMCANCGYRLTRELFVQRLAEVSKDASRS